MAFLSLDSVTIAYGGHPVLDDLTFIIERGDRVALLGRNGCGKSTLLKLICGIDTPDRGRISMEHGVSVAMLPQEIPTDLQGSAYNVVATALMSDHREEWEIEPLVKKALSLVSVNKDVLYNSLSAGNKRRVLLARAMAHGPDILLLDEPTNHLDIESVAWMEDFFSRYTGTLLFVTHDRFFLRRIANRIAEIDLGKLADWRCNYDKFLIHKNEQLNADRKERLRFDKKLSQEEEWIRRGVLARRTRNEGRVRTLMKMRKQFEERRDRQGSVAMSIVEANRSGKMVIEATNISFAYDTEPVIKDLSIRIMRGDRIGLIGGNGSGKSTLLKLLMGELEPTRGIIRRGTNQHPLYFDQLREQFDEELSVRENVLPNGEFIDINGQRKHVVGYLKDFLFTPESINSPVKMLSGGERNRLLLARLFTRAANLLILDEPTNDLDTETLELLEELLFNFSGTIIIVSHDRAILNNVVTSTIAYEGDGVFKEYVGGYDDWMEQRKKTLSVPKKNDKKMTKKRLQNKKLTYNETKELKLFPNEIEQMESSLEVLFANLSDPDFYKQQNQIVKSKREIFLLEEKLKKAYARWEELEERA